MFFLFNKDRFRGTKLSMNAFDYWIYIVLSQNINFNLFISLIHPWIVLIWQQYQNNISHIFYQWRQVCFSKYFMLWQTILKYSLLEYWISIKIYWNKNDEYRWVGYIEMKYGCLPQIYQVGLFLSLLCVFEIYGKPIWQADNLCLFTLTILSIQVVSLWDDFDVLNFDRKGDVIS